VNFCGDRGVKWAFFLYVIEARMYKKNLAFFIIKHKYYLIHEIVHFLSHHFHKHSPYNVKFANMVRI